MVVFLPLLVAIVGLLVYALSNNARVQEIGRLSFFAGLLAFLLGSAGHVVSALR